MSWAWSRLFHTLQVYCPRTSNAETSFWNSVNVVCNVALIKSSTSAGAGVTQKSQVPVLYIFLTQTIRGKKASNTIISSDMKLRKQNYAAHQNSKYK